MDLVTQGAHSTQASRTMASPRQLRQSCLPTAAALFAGNSQSSAGLSASSFGVLTAHANAPVVPEAAVSTDLLVPLQILAELGSQVVGKRLHGLARLPLALPVQEPLWDLELFRALDNSHQLFNFILGQLASARRTYAIAR